MCTEIWLPNNEYITNLGQARKRFRVLIGVADYDERYDIRNGPDESCCCPIDIPATALANGYDCEQDSDPFYHLLTPRADAKAEAAVKAKHEADKRAAEERKAG